MSGLAFLIDTKTDEPLAIFERVDFAQRERDRLDHLQSGRFVVQPYNAGGDAETVRRIRQLGGRLEAYTFN